MVTAIDAATGEIKVNELEKKTPLTIIIKQDAVLRRFPPPSELAGMMGGMGRGAVAARVDRAEPLLQHRHHRAKRLQSLRVVRPEQVRPEQVDREQVVLVQAEASTSTKCSSDCQLFQSLMLRLAIRSSFPVRRE